MCWRNKTSIMFSHYVHEFSLSDPQRNADIIKRNKNKIQRLQKCRAITVYIQHLQTYQMHLSFWYKYLFLNHNFQTISQGLCLNKRTKCTFEFLCWNPWKIKWKHVCFYQLNANKCDCHFYLDFFPSNQEVNGHRIQFKKKKNHLIPTALFSKVHLGFISKGSVSKHVH